MWTKLIRLWIQFNLIIGRFKPSEPHYFLCYTVLKPEELQKRLWPDWFVNLTGYTFKGQVLQLRSVTDNHQYHLRMIQKQKYNPGVCHIEVHYEARWECTWEHAHELDLRPLTIRERDDLRELIHPG